MPAGASSSTRAHHRHAAGRADLRAGDDRHRGPAVGDDRLARSHPDEEGCGRRRHRCLVHRPDHPAEWAWRVPSVLPRELGINAGRADFTTWDKLPPRRAVAAAGLRVFETRKCTSENFNRCPYTRRNWCGKDHPRPTPWGGLAVDDVAARFPAGELRTLRCWGITMLPGSGHRDAVFLVSPADFDLYEELTGWSGRVAFEPDSEDRAPQESSGAVDCRNDQPVRQMESRKGIRAIDPQTRMYCDSCGGFHPIIEQRKCRAGEVSS